jgi:hypothetical protein
MAIKGPETDSMSGGAEGARVRLQDNEEIVVALRRTGWDTTVNKTLTLGLYVA